MESLKVSILVPLYNVERYISKCAFSLFAQSYENCEFIFVDDASLDKSVEKLMGVVRNFESRHDQIKILHHVKNRGVATARNTALDAASGDYILFVDSDDWIDESLLERLVERARRTDADLCNVWCRNVMSNGAEEFTPTVWIGDSRTHFRALLGQSHLAQNIVRGVLIRRSLFEDNKLRFTPSVDFAEDYSLLPQILYYANRLSSLGEYLYSYRAENVSSYMNTIGERHIASYIAANKIVERFVASLPDAKEYRKEIVLGRLNIKKWIFKRGYVASRYDKQIFTSGVGTINPLLRLYNAAINLRFAPLVKLMSIIVNFPTYIKYRHALSKRSIS